jgi:hypothetical protein
LTVERPIGKVTRNKTFNRQHGHPSIAWRT